MGPTPLPTMPLHQLSDDTLMLAQTAWKTGRVFCSTHDGVPAEFVKIEAEAYRLSEALKLLADSLEAEDSILYIAEEETKHAVKTIFQSARKTVEGLERLIDGLQVIRKKETALGFVVEREWTPTALADYRTIKWTAEGGDIAALRSIMQMHTSSIDFTRQALQSQSLAFLKRAVVLMAEYVTTIPDKAKGDLRINIDAMHNIMTGSVGGTPTSRAISDRTAGRSTRGSAGSTTKLPRTSIPHGASGIPEHPATPVKSNPNPAQMKMMQSPRNTSAATSIYNLSPSTTKRSAREDSGFFDPENHENRWTMDLGFEGGLPLEPRGSIASPTAGGLVDSSVYSPHAAESPPQLDLVRRESATLPTLCHGIGEEPKSVPAGSPTAKKGYPASLQSQGGRRTQRVLISDDMLQHSRSASDDRSHPTASPARSLPWRVKSISPADSKLDCRKFEKQLFRNAAILCDVRVKLVEYAQFVPGITDPRYNVEMIPACEEARICVIRKRENSEYGGTKLATSIWCMSDDGQVRMQHKLSETAETVPYCSYFEPEKISLQPVAEAEVTLKFYTDDWGSMLEVQKKTNWVNYVFVSESDAVAFQSAIFGRTLLDSFRTVKTTVIHEGIKGAFAFEEQFANIEMLRLWEDDGITTTGAEGGVMALMHCSSNFGEGWARWWINKNSQHVKIKADGYRHAKVRGIDVTVVRPGGTSAPTSPVRNISSSHGGGGVGWGGGAVGGGGSGGGEELRKPEVKKVNGVRIEFKTPEEMSRFVCAVQEAQRRLLPLPDFP